MLVLSAAEQAEAAVYPKRYLRIFEKSQPLLPRGARSRLVLDETL
jgi:hypothetical protein